MLDELVKLTSIRDAELLEFSLLRTLHDVLNPNEMTLFHLNAAGDVTSQVGYSPELGSQWLETVSVTEMSLAIARADNGKGNVTHWTRPDGKNVAVFSIVESRGMGTHVEVVTQQAHTIEESRLVDGVLRLFVNYRSLLDYSQRDQLTGLMNRKTFDESIFKLFNEPHVESEHPVNPGRRSSLNKGRYWLGMLDIDHFKRINDGFGHLYGDEVLLLTAQVMQRTFRDADLLFRFGGEEFVVVTQNENSASAEAAFNRVRLAIAGHPFPQVGQVTASIGIVELLPGRLTAELLDHADKALYWAKQNGRNRVAVFDELVKKGELAIVESNASASTVDLF